MYPQIDDSPPIDAFLIEEREEEKEIGKGEDIEKFTNKPSCILASVCRPVPNPSENKTIELGIPTSMTYF